MHRNTSITVVLFRSSICPVEEPDTTEILAGKTPMDYGSACCRGAMECPSPNYQSTQRSRIVHNILLSDSRDRVDIPRRKCAALGWEYRPAPAYTQHSS